MFTEHRKAWLKGFTELSPTDPNEKMKVLEVGVGGGVNFEFFPERCQLTVLDYNECFEKECMINIEKYPNIEFDRFLVGRMEDMHQIVDNSFDAVLITDVLCSVGDVPKALSEVKRVLKEGGKFFFIEHVGYHESSLNHRFWALIQKAVNPIWSVIMYGCNLTRHPWVHLEKAGFKTIKINHSYPESLKLALVRARIWGWAEK